MPTPCATWCVHAPIHNTSTTALSLSLLTPIQCLDSASPTSTPALPDSIMSLASLSYRALAVSHSARAVTLH